MKSIFISYVYEDRKYLEKIKSWKEKGLLENCQLTFEKEDKRQEGKKEIKNYLKKKIKGVAIILILIGDNTHNSHWVEAEIELAHSFNKEVYCMRIPYTTGAKPKILNKYKELCFDPNQIIKKLEE